MATKIYDHITIDGDDAKLDASLIENLDNNQEFAALKEDLNAVFVVDSASGAVAHFEDGADNVPMKSVKVNIAPVQSGSGDPSPSNVRAISGWNSVNVYVSPTTDSEDATVYNISLSSAGTVYGGTLDVSSGVLTIDRKIVDLGSLTWAYSAPRFYSGSVTDGITPTGTGDLGAICENYSLYQTGVLANQPDLTFFVNSSKMSAGTKRIVICDSNYTDATALKTALDGVHLVYTLAEPQTVQLTAQQVNSLLGVNNVWSDAGDVDVEYRADTKLYIDKRLGV